MTALDLFAWLVLFILAVSAVAMFFIAGSLPGRIAKSRNHPLGPSLEGSRLGDAKVLLRQIAILNYINPF